jgi:hypothetical protein
MTIVVGVVVTAVVVTVGCSPLRRPLWPNRGKEEVMRKMGGKEGGGDGEEGIAASCKMRQAGSRGGVVGRE